jgi:hypothetical protein
MVVAPGEQAHVIGFLLVVELFVDARADLSKEVIERVGAQLSLAIKACLAAHGRCVDGELLALAREGLAIAPGYVTPGFC